MRLKTVQTFDQSDVKTKIQKDKKTERQKDKKYWRGERIIINSVNVVIIAHYPLLIGYCPLRRDSVDGEEVVIFWNHCPLSSCLIVCRSQDDTEKASEEVFDLDPENSTLTTAQEESEETT